MHAGAFQLQPSDSPPDEGGKTRGETDGFLDGENLPYKVEVWDSAGAAVEQVVAVSMTAVIGYAAFYAAAREYPGRGVTLRHNGRVISRWAGAAH